MPSAAKLSGPLGALWKKSGLKMQRKNKSINQINLARERQKSGQERPTAEDGTALYSQHSTATQNSSPDEAFFSLENVANFLNSDDFWAQLHTSTLKCLCSP